MLSVVTGLILKGVIFYSFLLTNVLESSTPAVLIEFNSFLLKVMPFLFILAGAVVGIVGQERLAQFQQANASFLYFVQSRYYYDNLLNKMSLFLLKCSTKVYLILDKGVLE
jgi:hypothetical protein